VNDVTLIYEALLLRVQNQAALRFFIWVRRCACGLTFGFRGLKDLGHVMIYFHITDIKRIFLARKKKDREN